MDRNKDILKEEKRILEEAMEVKEEVEQIKKDKEIILSSESFDETKYFLQPKVTSKEIESEISSHDFSVLDSNHTLSLELRYLEALMREHEERFYEQRHMIGTVINLIKQEKFVEARMHIEDNKEYILENRFDIKYAFYFIAKTLRDIQQKQFKSKLKEND